MARFDQRNQNVKYQYNVSGDINFGSVQNSTELIREFAKLQHKLGDMVAKNEIEPDLSMDIETKIKDVIRQVENPKPDKKSMLDYLQEAQKLIGGVASATAVIKMLAEAAEVIRRIF